MSHKLVQLTASRFQTPCPSTGRHRRGRGPRPPADECGNRTARLSQWRSGVASLLLPGPFRVLNLNYRRCSHRANVARLKNFHGV